MFWTTFIKDVGRISSVYKLELRYPVEEYLLIILK